MESKLRYNDRYHGHLLADQQSEGISIVYRVCLWGFEEGETEKSRIRKTKGVQHSDRRGRHWSFHVFVCESDVANPGICIAEVATSECVPDRIMV